MILPVAGLSMPHNRAILSTLCWLRLCALGYSEMSQISMQIDSRLTPSTLILSFLPLNLEVHCIAASLQHFDWHSINTTDLYRPVGLLLTGVASSTMDFASLVEPWTGFLTWRLLLISWAESSIWTCKLMNFRFFSCGAALLTLKCCLSVYLRRPVPFSPISITSPGNPPMTITHFLGSSMSVLWTDGLHETPFGSRA
jgi:hypothetical protein